MENNFEAYKIIRAKVLNNQPLLPEEANLWTIWEERFKDVMSPDITMEDLVSTIEYMGSTSSFDDYFETIKQESAVQLAVHHMATAQEAPVVESVRTTEATARKKAAWRTIPFRIAASITGVVIVGGFFLLLKPEGSHGAIVKPVKLTTNIQEYRKSILPDGSVVTLNAASTLSYPSKFTEDSRTVQLLGEAYIDAASMPGKPFIVISKNQQVKVLGTKFNVCAYPDQSTIKTTVVEGSVLVTVDKTERIVRAGQQAIVTDNNISINAFPAAKEMDSRKEDRFSFTLQPLPDILESLENWYGVIIKYQNFKDEYSDIRHTLDASKDLPVNRVLERLEKSKHLSFYPKEKNFNPGDTIWITNYNHNLNP